MPNYPRLSELPGFLPAAEPGTSEFDALVFGTFTNEKVNAEFCRDFPLSRLATQHPSQQTTLSSVPAQKKDVRHAS